MTRRRFVVAGAIGLMVWGGAGAQTLDLSVAERPELGERSVLAIALAALPGEAEYMDGARGAEAEARRALRSLTVAALEDARALGAEGDALAVAALALSDERAAIGRRFARLGAALERGAAPGATPRERLLAAGAWDRLTGFAVSAAALVGERPIDVAGVAGVFRRLSGPAYSDVAGGELGRIDDMLASARRALDGPGEGEEALAMLDASSVSAYERLIDVAALMSRMPGEEARAARLAEDLDTALEIGPLIRRTRWASRRDLLAAGRALSAAVVRRAASGEDGLSRPSARPLNEAIERVHRVGRVAELIGLVEAVRADRMDSRGAGEVVGSLVSRMADLHATDAATDELDAVMDTLERVLRSMLERRDLPELRDVPRELRPVWRVLDEEARSVEVRVMRGLGRVLAQPEPMVGPEGVSLVASLSARVDRLEVLSRLPGLARSLRADGTSASIAAGNRLMRLLDEAADLSNDDDGSSAMALALDRALWFGTQYEALFAASPAEMALRAAADGDRKSLRAVGFAIAPGAPRSVDARTLNGFLARLSTDREEWLLAWGESRDGVAVESGVGRPGSNEPQPSGERGPGRVQRDRLAAAQRVLVTIGERIDLVEALDAMPEDAVAGQGVWVGEDEVGAALELGAAAARRAIDAIARGDAGAAESALDRAAGELGVARRLATMLANEPPRDVTAWLSRMSEEGEATSRRAEIARWLWELESVSGSIDPGPRDAVAEYLIEVARDF